MNDVITYVGIDAHKKDLFMAMLTGDQRTPVSWTIANEPRAVRRLVKKLEREAPGAVHVFYEAGPCGYALQRQMTTTRVRCEVVAPALIPRTPGERVKTNRRDARKLVSSAVRACSRRCSRRRQKTRRCGTWHGPAMMPAKICSAVGIGSASCCCGGASTTRAATGRARTASGSRG